MACIVCATLCGDSLSFTTAPIPTVRHVSLLFPAQTQLNAISSETLDYVHSSRLTPEEETDFLRQAVEMRRLSNIEAEMAMKSPTRQVPLLSVRAKTAGYGDELDLYEDAMHNGQMARETLVTRNMGLVHFCVNQIIGKKKMTTTRTRLNSLSREDLVQEGAIGLARAVDKWNPAIGGKFSTYAIYWVRATVYRCIAEHDDVVRVPDHVSRAIRQVNKAARIIGLEIDNYNVLSDTSSWEEARMAKLLAQKAGLTDKQLAEAMKARSRRYTGGYVPFDTWMQKGRDLEADTPTAHAELGIPTMETEHLKQMLSKFLRPKEMEALSWRYGLVNENGKVDYLAKAELELFGSIEAQPVKKEIPVKGKWGEAMSFTEVGKNMQVSAEYGRRLCHAALDKLRRAAEDGRLEPGLLF
jgi:RNA polymerase nonessential primary-like sigma factor